MQCKLTNVIILFHYQSRPPLWKSKSTGDLSKPLEPITKEIVIEPERSVTPPPVSTYTRPVSPPVNSNHDDDYNDLNVIPKRAFSSMFNLYESMDHGEAQNNPPRTSSVKQVHKRTAYKIDPIIKQCICNAVNCK